MQYFRIALLVAIGLTATVCRAEARVVYVNRTASGAADGTSWDNAFARIQDGLDDAGQGDEVWVAAGTYVENINLHGNMGLYGGFKGDESDRADRNPAVNFTSIDGGRKASTVSIDFGAGPQTILDGFRIRNGRDNNEGAGGGGIYSSNLVTGTISNNVITENIASQGGGIASQYGAVTIANNLITDNEGFLPGIVAYGSGGNNPNTDAPIIVNNTIVNNHTTNGNSYALTLGSLDGAVIANNIVAFNGNGVNVYNSMIVFLSNDVYGNPAGNFTGIAPVGTNGNLSEDPLFVDPDHAFFYLDSSSPAVDSGSNGAVVGDVDLGNAPRVQNGAVDMGAYEGEGPAYRLIFTEQPGNGITGGALDPQPVVEVRDNSGQLASDFNGDITVAIDPGSGNSDATLDGTTTVTAENGVAAFNDLTVSEAGAAYVLDATADGALPAQSKMFEVHSLRYYVRADGSDDDEGLSWDTAKQTIQAALDEQPGELWVAEGTYTENLEVKNAVRLYGGFAGDEDTLDDRDLDAEPTVLDGDGQGVVLTSGQAPTINVLDGFTITNGNADGGSGGGAYINDFTGTIANVKFDGNFAGDSGGGLYLECAVNNPPTNVTLENLRFANNDAVRGAGAFITNFVGTMTNAEFTNNSAADSGGGMYLESKNNNSQADITLQDVSFDANSAANDGGGLLADMQFNQTAPNVLYSAMDFSNNASRRGGGAYLKGDAKLFDGSSFTNNSATLGGGLYIENYLDAESGSFTGNGILNAADDAAGGAVYVQGGAYLYTAFFTFDNNQVSAMPGHSANGGAVAAPDGGSFYLFGSTITRNKAGDGGAVYSVKNGASIVQSVVTGNTASGNGGAVYVKTGSALLESSLIAHNTAGGYGGGVALDAAPLYRSPANPVQLRNNTIVDNSAPGGGGGVDARNGTAIRAESNIIAFNSSGIQLDASSSVIWYKNDVFGNTTGGNFQGTANPIGTFGNISSDPLFVNRPTSDYHLAAGSPAIDAGDGGAYTPYYQDVAFQTRVQGARVDMGAYESTGALATMLQWNDTPTGGPAPGLLTVQPSLSVRSSDGVLQTGYSGSVTIAFKPGLGTTGATLGGAKTVPVVNGVATFTNLTIDKGGAGYVLTASLAGGISLDSPPITMTTAVVRASPIGSDSNDGSTWALAKRNPQAALDQVQPGGAVWLHSGTYTGVVRTQGGGLLGGFAGTETAANQRNPKTNVTVLDADHLTDAINVQSNGGGSIAFDGLTIRNAAGSGIVSFVDNMTASNNIFTGNSGGFGGGVLSFGNDVVISRNQFLQNPVTISGGGVYVLGRTTIDNNLFAGNSGPQDGSAITASVGDSLNIVNNTITGGTGPGGAIQLYQSPAVITNNIIANNQTGINRGFGASANVTLSHNDIFGNTSFNYQNLAAGATDIAADPLFVNAAGGNFQLQTGSPAIDAGDDSSLTFSPVDLAGNPRKVGAHIDIGAFEWLTAVVGIPDVTRALQIAGGLATATNGDLTRLNVENIGASQNKIDARDATRLMRQLTGTDAAP